MTQWLRIHSAFVAGPSQDPITHTGLLKTPVTPASRNLMPSSGYFFLIDDVRISLPVLNSIPLIDVSVFMTVPCCFYKEGPQRSE